MFYWRKRKTFYSSSLVIDQAITLNFFSSMAKGIQMGLKTLGLLQFSSNVQEKVADGIST